MGERCATHCVTFAALPAAHEDRAPPASGGNPSHCAPQVGRLPPCGAAPFKTVGRTYAPVNRKLDLSEHSNATVNRKLNLPKH